MIKIRGRNIESVSDSQKTCEHKKMPDMDSMRQSQPRENESEQHGGYLRHNYYSMSADSIGESAADGGKKKNRNL